MADRAPNPSKPTKRLSGGYVSVDPVARTWTIHEPPIQIHNPDDLIAPATDNPTPAREVPSCDRGIKRLTPPPISFAAPAKVGKSGSGKPAPAGGKNRPPKRK